MIHTIRRRFSTGSRSRFALVLALLAGCSNSIERNVALQAPPGWVHSTGPQGGELWLHPGAREYITLRQVDDAEPAGSVPGESRMPIRICGDHPAFFVSTAMTAHQVWDSVETDWDAKSYVATYVRQIGTQADPVAETAIRSMCESMPSEAGTP
jgi:hypothetical protein